MFLIRQFCTLTNKWRPIDGGPTCYICINCLYFVIVGEVRVLWALICPHNCINKAPCAKKSLSSSVEAENHLIEREIRSESLASSGLHWQLLYTSKLTGIAGYKATNIRRTKKFFAQRD